MNPRLLITLTVFLGAALLLAPVGCSKKHPDVVAIPPPVVEVAQPIVDPAAQDYQIFTARTKAVQSVELKARVTGYLNDILFKDGDMVEDRQVLFQIDDGPYKAALDQAKASLEFSEAALVKAQADLDIGLAVQKQDKGAISVQEITKRTGARDEAKASIDQATAVLANAQLNFNWCKVKAPIAGRASRHLVDVGNVVNQNVTVLVNIVSLKPMWAYISVDQNTSLAGEALVEGGKIKPFRGGEVPVSMNVGVGEFDKFPIAGVVDYVSNQLDSTTGTLQVRARFENTNEMLVSGLFARIKVPTSAPHEALLVNEQAIGADQGQKFILVLNADKEVEYRPIEVGLIHNGLREIKPTRTVTEPGPDGKMVTRTVEVLKKTDWVIVNGLQRVRPGDKAEPEPADMITLLRKPGTQKKPAAASQ